MLELNYRDAKPIYEQIKDGLRKLVLSGAIQKDERLPSVRELASQLAINPNTIQKAYRELEQEGYIYTVSGRGSFAAPLSDVQDGRQEALLCQMKEAATELLYLGKSKAELKKEIDEIKTPEESKAQEQKAVLEENKEQERKDALKENKEQDKKEALEEGKADDAAVIESGGEAL